MTLDQFEKWLTEHPEAWRKLPPRRRTSIAELPLQPPAIYLEFLQRFGPFCWFSDKCFMDIDEIAEDIAFIRSLASSTEEPEAFECIPFMSLGYDRIMLCFQNESIIDFDPGSGEVTFVANSFPEFLERFIEAEGQQFWLQK